MEGSLVVDKRVSLDWRLGSSRISSGLWVSVSVSIFSVQVRNNFPTISSTKFLHCQLILGSQCFVVISVLEGLDFHCLG